LNPGCLRGRHQKVLVELEGSWLLSRLPPHKLFLNLHLFKGLSDSPIILTFSEVFDVLGSSPISPHSHYLSSMMTKKKKKKHLGELLRNSPLKHWKRLSALVH
jgi:hypothetical protein